MKSEETDQISDGFHTFGELYDHRRALTAALCRALPPRFSWRSRAHHPADDEPMFTGYFLVGIELPTGSVRYHIELQHWDDFSGVLELPCAPLWDGAGPPETITRLLAYAKTEEPE